jgi:hypothetical protein
MEGADATAWRRCRLAALERPRLVARGRSGTAAEARDAMEAGMCKDRLAGPEAECGR